MLKVAFYITLLGWSWLGVKSLDVCEDQVDGTRLAHPADCTRFIQCHGGATVAIRYCPFGLHFNRYELICDFKFRAGCDFSYALQLVGFDSGSSKDCDECRAKCSGAHGNNPIGPVKPPQLPCKPTAPTPGPTKPSKPPAPTPCPNEPPTPNPSTPAPETPSTPCSTKPATPAPPTPCPNEPPTPTPPPPSPITPSTPCSTEPAPPTPCPNEPSSPPTPAPETPSTPCSTKPSTPIPSTSCSNEHPTAPTPAPEKRPALPTPSTPFPQKPTPASGVEGDKGNPQNPPSITGPSVTTCANPGKCAGQRDGKLFADDLSNGFIVCQCECEIKMTCPAGLVFNEHLQVCDWPQS